MYPECGQEELVSWHFKQNIMPVGYSPLGRMGERNPEGQTFETLTHPYVLELAAKYDKSPVQIALAWGLSRGYAIVPKSSSDKNQLSNIAVLNFRLPAEEV